MGKRRVKFRLTGKSMVPQTSNATATSEKNAQHDIGSDSPSLLSFTGINALFPHPTWVRPHEIFASELG